MCPRSAVHPEKAECSNRIVYFIADQHEESIPLMSGIHCILLNRKKYPASGCFLIDMVTLMRVTPIIRKIYMLCL